MGDGGTARGRGEEEEEEEEEEEVKEKKRIPEEERLWRVERR